MRRRKRNYQSHAPPPREGQETFPYTEFSYKLSFNRPFKAESFFDRVGINPRGTPKIQRQTKRRRTPLRETRRISLQNPSNSPFNAKKTIGYVGEGLLTRPRGTTKIQWQTKRRRGTLRENLCASQKEKLSKPRSAAAGRSGDLPLYGIQQQTAVQQAFPRKSAVSYTNASTQNRKLLPPKKDKIFKSTSPIFANTLLHPKMTKKSLHRSTQSLRRIPGLSRENLHSLRISRGEIYIKKKKRPL